MSAFLFFCFSFSVFLRLRVAQKTCTNTNLYSVSRPDYISQRPLLPHTHKKKQSLSLRHNKALAYIPSTRSSLLLQHMASKAREGCQPVRRPVLFLVLDGSVGHILVASRKHRPHLSSLHAPLVPARASVSKGMMIVCLAILYFDAQIQ